MVAEEERYRNKASVAVLTGPDYATPSMKQYEAVPRPEAVPYYNLELMDSDVEHEHETKEEKEADGYAAISLDSDTSVKPPSEKRLRICSP